MESLARGLSERLGGGDRIRTNARVTHIDFAAQSRDAPVKVTLDSGEEILARSVVVALPPRIAASLTYNPPLPPRLQQELGSTYGWMSAHAKFFAGTTAIRRSSVCV
jgi:monoamine oxidase